MTLLKEKRQLLEAAPAAARITTSTPPSIARRENVATITPGAPQGLARGSTAITSRTGREARGDRGNDVASGGGVDARPEPDRAGEAGRPALALRGEEALGGQRAPQEGERCRVVTRTKALEGHNAQADLPAGLVERERPIRLDALPYRERQLSMVDRLHGIVAGEGEQAGPRVLERQEDRRPRRLRRSSEISPSTQTSRTRPRYWASRRLNSATWASCRSTAPGS